VFILAVVESSGYGGMVEVANIIPADRPGPQVAATAEVADSTAFWWRRRRRWILIYLVLFMGAFCFA